MGHDDHYIYKGRLMDKKGVDRKLDRIGYGALYPINMSFDYFKGLVRRVSDFIKGNKEIKLNEENSRLVEQANSQVEDYAKIIKDIYKEKH